MARSSSFLSLTETYFRAGNLAFGGGDVITAAPWTDDMGRSSTLRA